MNDVTVTRADRIAFLNKEIDAMAKELRRLSDEQDADTLLPRMKSQIGKHFKTPNGNPYWDKWVHARVVGVRDGMFRILAFCNDVQSGRISIQESTVSAERDGSMMPDYVEITDDEFRAAVAPMLQALVKECGVEQESFNDVCDRIARDLPAGWDMLIELSPSSGDVTLIDPDGDKVEFPSNRECMLDEVNDALEEARKIDRDGFGASA